MRFDPSPHCSCSISDNWISQATSLEDDHCSAFLHWLQTKAGTRISSVLAVATSSFGRSGLPLNKLPIYLFFYYLSVRTSPCSLYGVFAVCFPVILICLVQINFWKHWSLNQTFSFQVVSCIGAHKRGGLYIGSTLQCCKFLNSSTVLRMPC